MCRAPVQRLRCGSVGGAGRKALAVVGAVWAAIGGAAVAGASLMGRYRPGDNGGKEVVGACRDTVQFGAVGQVFRFPPIGWIIAGRGQFAAQILKPQDLAKALLGGDFSRGCGQAVWGHGVTSAGLVRGR